MNHKVAIAVEETGEGTEIVAEHFARCSKFSLYELNEDKNVIKTESVFNPLNGHHGGTCQLPGYIRQFDINTIIAGGMGRKAVENFHSFKIDVITAPGMSADDALKSFIAGNLSGYEACAGDENEHECN
jgi:predicted Fe-Mo cluster-binding NifX family protein